MDICHQDEPEYREVLPGRFVACHHYNDVSTSAGSTAASEASDQQSLSNTNNTTN
jgi:oligopeptide transport system ATP-binding protein